MILQSHPSAEAKKKIQKHVYTMVKVDKQRIKKTFIFLSF